MAAQVKEIVVDTDLLYAQGFLPDLGNSCFGFARRGEIGSLKKRPLVPGGLRREASRILQEAIQSELPGALNSSVDVLSRDYDLGNRAHGKDVLDRFHGCLRKDFICGNRLWQRAARGRAISQRRRQYLFRRSMFLVDREC